MICLGHSFHLYYATTDFFIQVLGRLSSICIKNIISDMNRFVPRNSGMSFYYKVRWTLAYNVKSETSSPMEKLKVS